MRRDDAYLLAMLVAALAIKMKVKRREKMSDEFHDATDPEDTVPDGWLRLPYVRRSRDEIAYIQISHIVCIVHDHLEGYSIRLSDGKNYYSQEPPLDLSSYEWTKITKLEAGWGHDVYFQRSHVVRLVQGNREKYTVWLSNGRSYSTEEFPFDPF